MVSSLIISALTLLENDSLCNVNILFIYVEITSSIVYCVVMINLLTDFCTNAVSMQLAFRKH